MKEAKHAQDIKVEIVDSPIPEPPPGHITVRVVNAASNPKDWKLPHWKMIEGPFNHGDDFAGYVHSIGAGVSGFHKGDRVACFHQMMSPHGAYAEYAIAPVNTSFHIPANVSFEEAVTVTLPAYTAAVGLSQRLKLPAPWESRRDEFKGKPIIVYGGATAVGAFGIKFLKLAGLGPIIAVAGKGKDFVQSLLGPEDKIVDYRDGDIVENLKAALAGKECHYALDAVSEHDSYIHLSQVLSKPGKITCVLPVNQEVVLPEGITADQTTVWTCHADDVDFAAAYSTFFTRALGDGRLKGHPVEVLGGLEKVEEGLRRLKNGEVSARRLVYKISEA